MKWYAVKVYFEDGSIEDAIKGENEELAIDNAIWNWPEAVYIELLEK